jgi:hypothetical protein
MDQNGCPADYEDLVRNYYSMARSIVAKYPGVRPEDVEDLTQDMMLKFIAKDALSWYDPNKVFETPSGPRTARFATLFRSVIRKYLRSPVETLSKKAAREPVRLEQPNYPTTTGELWMEVYGPVDLTSTEDEVFLSTELDRAYRHLGTVQLGPDMMGDAVLRAMVQTADENGGHLRRAPLAERLGVQDTTATRWIRKVRLELDGIGFLQDPGLA